MFAALPSLKSMLAHARARILAIVGVLAVAGALGFAAVSAPPTAEKLPAVAGDPVGVAEASFDRPPLDVDGFGALERRLADERRERAQAMLDRLYPGRAFVTVGVELDPRWERTVEKVQPDWPAVVEEERPEAGGTGVRRRVLEPWSGTREIGLLAPKVRRVSAALVLDESIAGDRSKRDAIVSAVAKAVGLEQVRDPEVEVLIDRLPGVAVPEAAATPRVAGAPMFTVDFGGWAALTALISLLFAWIWMRRSARSRRIPAPAALPVDGDDSDALRREIENAIGEEPDSVARIVEGWLAETKA